MLKVGSVGKDVSRLQRALTAGSKRTPVTGVFDQKTEKAVSKYQKKAELPRTGVVTPEVWDAFLRLGDRRGRPGAGAAGPCGPAGAGSRPAA